MNTKLTDKQAEVLAKNVLITAQQLGIKIRKKKKDNNRY